MLDYEQDLDIHLIDLTKNILNDNETVEQLSTISQETNEAKQVSNKRNFQQISSLSINEKQPSKDFEQPEKPPKKRTKL